MAKIKEIHATEILDSRGNPTLEVSVTLSDETIGTASCPSGASVSSYEAVELRDGDMNRFKGLGMLRAVENIEKLIAPVLLGMDVDKQADIDRTMIDLDGTQNKSRLGGNTTLSVSMAVAKAAAKSAHLPLFLYLRQFIKKDEGSQLRIPTPLFNIINGGLHAGGQIDFQEFIITPASSKTYTEGLQIGVSIYMTLKEILVKKGLRTLVGDEGGFAPKLAANVEALSLMKEAIDGTNYHFGYDVFFGIDVAANSFYQNKEYHLKDKPMGISSKDLIVYYQECFKQFPVLYFEDPFGEDDWDGWAAFSQQVPRETLVVGDDLISTNPYRLQMAIDKKVVGGIIVKPNQIGTVIEALAVVEVARQAGLRIIVSHRSGESNDDFIADFAVAVSADYMKFGAPARGERVAKYNRLLHIEQQLKQINETGTIV